MTWQRITDDWHLQALVVRAFIEPGPGTILADLLGFQAPGAPVRSVGTWPAMCSLLAEVQAQRQGEVGGLAVGLLGRLEGGLQLFPKGTKESARLLGFPTFAAYRLVPNLAPRAGAIAVYTGPR